VIGLVISPTIVEGTNYCCLRNLGPSLLFEEASQSFVIGATANRLGYCMKYEDATESSRFKRGMRATIITVCALSSKDNAQFHSLRCLYGPLETFELKRNKGSYERV
jgi:hypothetical protein